MTTLNLLNKELDKVMNMVYPNQVFNLIYLSRTMVTEIHINIILPQHIPLTIKRKRIFSILINYGKNDLNTN